MNRERLFCESLDLQEKSKGDDQKVWLADLSLCAGSVGLTGVGIGLAISGNTVEGAAIAVIGGVPSVPFLKNFVSNTIARINNQQLPELRSSQPEDSK